MSSQSRAPRWIGSLGVASLLCLGVPSCGAKTGLLQPEAVDVSDAGADVPESFDAQDAQDAQDATDAVPPIDVLPPPDVTPFCTDPSVQLIYTVTSSNELLSFEPPSATFRSIGTIRCPARSGTPFSMAVDHAGSAYVAFSDGELFKVNVKDASCAATSYRGPGGTFLTFGMGFARDATGSGETLFVASASSPPTLARIEIPALTLTSVALLDNSVSSAELTGTGAGQLFGFFADASKTDGSSSIAEIDKLTGRIAGRADFPSVRQGSGWAFAFWGGDFYMFTAPSGSSVVTRFRPADGSLAQVASWPGVIVGAGVSTCAPG
jgi:hypothetical protein